MLAVKPQSIAEAASGLIFFFFSSIMKEWTLISSNTTELEFQVVWLYVSSSEAIFFSLSCAAFSCLELAQTATKWLNQSLANYFQV